MTAPNDGAVRIWDASRIAAMAGPPGVVLTAALARGVGWRTDRERADLLMQDAPEDLYAEACKQLGRAADDPEIAEIAAGLRAPLQPNCYLSPTQLAEKFGLALPARAAEGAAPADASEGPWKMRRQTPRTRRRRRPSSPRPHRLPAGAGCSEPR